MRVTNFPETLSSRVFSKVFCIVSSTSLHLPPAAVRSSSILLPQAARTTQSIGVCATVFAQTLEAVLSQLLPPGEL